MIDKSIRQYYQDGEKVGPFEKGFKMIAKGEFAPKDVKEMALGAGESILNEKYGLMYPIAKMILNKSQGEKNIDSIINNLADPKNLKTTAGKNLVQRLLGKNFASGLAKGILPIAAITGGAVLANKYRKQLTGYDTQREYEEARDLRILETRRADILQRKEEGKSYSDTNLGQVTREIAEKKGLDINNPNEMKNIDKDIEDIKIEKILLDEPSFIGEGYDITEPLGIEEMMWQEVSEGRDRPGSSGQTVAETAAMEDIAPAPPAPPTPVTYYAPSPEQHGGGGDRHGGGGGYGRGRDPGGGAAGSPFKKGGRIDKPLTGRSRDI